MTGIATPFVVAPTDFKVTNATSDIVGVNLVDGFEVKLIATFAEKRNVKLEFRLNN